MNVNPTTTETQTQTRFAKRDFDHQTIYAFGRVEAWLETYAKSIDRSASQLIERVGTLLLSQGQGIEHNLPEMRGYATKVGRPVGKMEMARHPRTKLHWTQKPENHKKVLAIARKAQKYWKEHPRRGRLAEAA